MYKCTDCGQEYKIRPEYCDCGNNTFEEFEVPQDVHKTVSNNICGINPAPKDLKADILSWFIFSVCIILSILSLIFIGKDSENKSPESVNIVKEQKNTDIPSIDELWVKSSSFVQKPLQEEESSVFRSIFKPKKQTVSVIKRISKPKEASANHNTSHTGSSNTVVQQQSMTEEQKDALVKRLTGNTANVQKKTEPVVDEAKLKRELTAYKISLRNRIAANIDFAKVIGDGNCAVTFKIDSSGNLIERNFSLQSQNNSLNDVVYSAMLQNPAFQHPPQGYKNEVLTLSVKMYGGNFEVTLK